MSKTLSKKEKRPRTSSKEINTSFVKNVTSRVSGLLPATITKWFSSPSSSNANGSATTAEATDSSTEDEGPESPIVMQPPTKRMRFNTSNKFNHYSSTDANCTASNIEKAQIPVSHFPSTQFPTSRSSLTFTPIRKPNETFTNESLKDRNERDSARFKSTQHTIASIGHSVAAKRKSIFDKTSNDIGTTTNPKPSTSDRKKPCFKPALLGSPFYPGRTIYGGASSSYINQPNIQQHTVALVNETKTNEDSAMSTSARRIMDLLESYSSPLMEARRIPQYTKPKNESFNTSTNQSSPYDNRSLSYKTQELYVPSIASILRLKQRSRLMDTTKAARQIIASHSSASSCSLPYPTPATNISEKTKTRHANQKVLARSDPETEQNNKMTTKVKTRVARTNRGNHDQVEMSTPVKLPSATLQIDQNKLPNFTFETPAFTKLPATSTPKVVLPVPKSVEIKKDTEVSTSKPETVPSTTVFKFSKPIEILCDSRELETTPPIYTFDSPERRIDQNCDSKSDVSSVVGKINEIDKSANAQDWVCPDCWVNNKSEASKCACCGYKTIKAAKCSVCKLADSMSQNGICVNCDKMAHPLSAKPNQLSKWKCNGCWVMNDDSEEKCSCCGGSKPTAASKEVTPAAAAAIIAKTKVKTVPTCGGCFTVSSSKFNANAENVKPLPLSAKTTNFFGSNNEGDSTFVSLAKTQKSDKWECSSCLVRNESDKSACVCCGAEKEPKSKIPETKFNFGLNNNTSFKFGIDPKVQATLVKKPEVQITPDSKLKEQSETNNNVLAETPTFNFTLPTKKTETMTESVEEKPSESVKFNFGIPKNVSLSTNKFEPSKITEEDKEKLQEVPQVKFTSALEENPKFGGLFSAPLTKEVEKDKPLTTASNLFTFPAVEAKKDAPNNSIQSQTLVTSVEKTQPQSTFTLSSSTLKPASNLFGIPSTVTTSTNLFSSPGQSSAVTMSTPTAALVMPLAVIQKSETPTLLSAPAAPIFSFGNNGVNNITPMSSVSVATPVEKPKFQFTFGNNNPPNTEPAPSLLTASSNTQSLFKPNFAPPNENNSKNINTFSLTPGNALLSNNALTPGNALVHSALSGTNGISASNGLVPNTLSGNTLGGNMLSGNGLSGNMLANNTIGNNTMAANTFGSNTLTSGNGISSTSTLGGTNGLPGITHSGGNTLQSSNVLNSNSLSSNPPIIFGSAVQKENIWNSNLNNNAPSTNLFVSNATTNSLQKPTTFTFGTSTQFNATSSTPAFGSNAQPTQNIFGMAANQNNSSQPNLFSNPVSNQTSTMFGSPQPNSIPAPQLGMFGTPSIGATPPFGASSASLSSFEAPSMTAAPVVAFNFGAQAQSTPVFGFGQQPQQQQEQTGGVYSFGAQPQVQFNMGTASNPTRRIRKAARRTQR